MTSVKLPFFLRERHGRKEVKNYERIMYKKEICVWLPA